MTSRRIREVWDRNSKNRRVSRNRSCSRLARRDTRLAAAGTDERAKLVGLDLGGIEFYAGPRSARGSFPSAAAETPAKVASRRRHDW